MDNIQFTSEEKKVISDFFEELSNASKFPQSLELTIKNWQEFISTIEQGYELTIYDYSNDLSGRGILEEVLQKLSPATQSRLMEIIQPIDNQFKNITVEIKKQILGTTDSSWWSFRMPKNPGEELKKDLQDEGLEANAFA